MMILSYIVTLKFTMWLTGSLLLVLCPQARNIAVCIEFKESDEEDAVSLKVNFHRQCPGSASISPPITGIH